MLSPKQQPLALLLQQHNYLRLYLRGQDFEIPADDRVRLVAAIGSNELYPDTGMTAKHRAVSFIAADNIDYLITGNDEPWFAASDVADPQRDVDYQLDFIPPTDAFYTFNGHLGSQRWLPGRDGPPGADYNTWPQYKPLSTQLVLFNWRSDDLDALQQLTALLNAKEADDSAAWQQAFSQMQQRLLNDLKSVLSQYP